MSITISIKNEGIILEKKVDFTSINEFYQQLTSLEIQVNNALTKLIIQAQGLQSLPQKKVKLQQAQNNDEEEIEEEQLQKE